MKRQGILNTELAGLTARLGHTELVCVADCGLPVPRDVHLVDLALVPGVPRFVDVVSALLDELVVEGHTVASEAEGQVADRMITSTLGSRGGTRTSISHEEFKTLVKDAAFVVRTGETTPYCNLILRCGVPF